MIWVKEETRFRLSQTKSRLALGIVAILAILSGATLAFLFSGPVLVEAIIPPAALSQPLPGLAPPSASEIAHTGVSVPVRLRIARIGVDAAIEHVGLTVDGAMDVPKDPQNAGWYKLGHRPGETGTATIAGHVDWFGGATGVFEDLRQLKPWDTIEVQDANGEVASFVVREIRIYDPDADATEIFFSNDGKAHLNLITCEGVWDKNAGQYTERRVVFSDRIENTLP